MKKEPKNLQSQPNDRATNQFAVLQSILKMGPSKDDPQGMYTGKPMDPGEVPVQDGDDL